MPEKLTGEFSNWLNSMIHERGLSARDVAAGTGISESFVSRIRKGTRLPKLDMAHKLADFFRVDRASIPDILHCASRDKSNSLDAIYTIDHAIPDHAMILAPRIKKVFSTFGVSLYGKAPYVHSHGYPSSSYHCIDSAIYQSIPALACGPKSFFVERAGVTPVSIETHRYRGFAMITKASTKLASAYGCPIEVLPGYFRELVEILDESELFCGGSNEDRISCLGLEEIRFVRAIQGIKSELVDGEIFDPSELDHCLFTRKIPFGKALERLDLVGCKGADIIVGDAMCLSQGLYDKNYKIIFTLNELIRLIKYIGLSKYRGWKNALQATYGTSCASEAQKMFYEKWSVVAKNLELPIFWHLYVPKEYSFEHRERLIHNVRSAFSTIREHINSVRRTDILNEIYQRLIDQHNSRCDLDSFYKSWAESYVGI